MSASFTLNANGRADAGKGASRRLRRLEGRLPAVIYGGSKEAQSISLELRELNKALESEAFYSHILTINIDGQPQQAVLKALQRHPAKNTPMHADFLRVDATHKLTMKVPLHFLNQDTCVGVKLEGGELAIMANEVEVACLPGNLPEYIEVDLKDVHIGTTLHLSDITMPKNVEIPSLALGHDYDQPIANVHKSRVESDEPKAAE
ncbi:MAG: ribosomal protein L25/ral stress protein Ctc [Moraxellaceae bacterium]|jgi:large subunit ribosomal protein L25|nr:ribosomal protein L25/ral stress protein Ctc [Moraxellaceae bacterium]MDF3030377.1 ribosomal protein L25/ral stress protein Ctc [Moraxellaceae bacterium]